MPHSLWLLDPSIHYLNHGSFGATPIPVLDEQNRFRQQLEQEPVRFFAQEWEGLLDQARATLAQFVQIEAENIAFIPNATYGVNTVLRSLSFSADDEILITNHIYNACHNVVNFIAQQTGAKIVTAHIPFPLANSKQITTAILEKVTKKTKIVLLDHVTSQTALIFPLEPIIKALSDRHIDTLIDGAHAVGFLPLNLHQLGATYYTGNCHKWLCAPKGAAFLYVRPDKQAQMRPLVISHGANSPRTDRSRFLLEFDWLGTGDPSAYLAVAKAIDVMGNLLAGGWEALWERNNALARQGRQILLKSLKKSSPCPENLLGAMATIPLEKAHFSLSAETLIIQLREKHQIEVPVFPWNENLYLLRISAQFYNNLSQYEYLATVLQQEISV